MEGSGFWNIRKDLKAFKCNLIHSFVLGFLGVFLRLGDMSEAIFCPVFIRSVKKVVLHKTTFSHLWKQAFLCFFFPINEMKF